LQEVYLRDKIKKEIGEEISTPSFFVLEYGFIGKKRDYLEKLIKEKLNKEAQQKAKEIINSYKV